jgi:TIR domain
LLTGDHSARLMLSWAHKDQRDASALMRLLTPHLSILRDVEVELWSDAELALGGRFEREIVERIDWADYGLLLVSESYLASKFVTEIELPRFVGPTADRGALPVALRPLPFDGSRELRGLEKTQIFHYRGKAFSELNRPGQDAFARELATRIRDRILRDRILHDRVLRVRGGRP